MSSELIFISGFIVFILIMLSLDLGLFAKHERAVTLKQAAIMSVVWVSLALGFYMLILNYGHLLHHVDSYSALQERGGGGRRRRGRGPGGRAGGGGRGRGGRGREGGT